jgi:hypothetical protein
MNNMKNRELSSLDHISTDNIRLPACPPLAWPMAWPDGVFNIFYSSILQTLYGVPAYGMAYGVFS